MPPLVGDLISNTSLAAALPAFAIPFLADGSAQTWSNMPAAEDNFRSATHNRVVVDLTRITEVQLTTIVDTTAGVAGSILSVEYTTDLTGGGVWAELAASGAVTVDVTALGGRAGAWTAIAVGAQGVVMLRLRGSGGDGTRDPIFGTTILWAR